MGQCSTLDAFVAALVRDGQFLAALSAAGSENGTASGRRHALAKSVLVATLANRGLKSPFHDNELQNRERKDRQRLGNSRPNGHFTFRAPS